MAIVISGNGIDMGNSPISNVDIQNDVDVVDKEYADLKVALTGDQTIAGVKTFSSSPIAPTAAAGTNTTQIATTAFVQYAITNQVFGVGQTWQDVSNSRAIDTTYINNTGKPIMVNVTVGGLNSRATIIIQGVSQGLNRYNLYDANYSLSASFIVPNNATYKINNDSAANIKSWIELR